MYLALKGYMNFDIHPLCNSAPDLLGPLRLFKLLLFCPFFQTLLHLTAQCCKALNYHTLLTYIHWSSRSGEKWAATWKFVCHARLKIHNKCFNSAMVLQKMAKFAHGSCTNSGTPLKVFQPRKVKKTDKKNWKKLEKSLPWILLLS